MALYSAWDIPLSEFSEFSRFIKSESKNITLPNIVYCIEGWPNERTVRVLLDQNYACLLRFREIYYIGTKAHWLCNVREGDISLKKLIDEYGFPELEDEEMPGLVE